MPNNYYIYQIPNDAQPTCNRTAAWTCRFRWSTVRAALTADNGGGVFGLDVSSSSSIGKSIAKADIVDDCIFMIELLIWCLSIEHCILFGSIANRAATVRRFDGDRGDVCRFCDGERKVIDDEWILVGAMRSWVAPKSNVVRRWGSDLEKWQKNKFCS